MLLWLIGLILVAWLGLFSKLGGWLGSMYIQKKFKVDIHMERFGLLEGVRGLRSSFGYVESLRVSFTVWQWIQSMGSFPLLSLYIHGIEVCIDQLPERKKKKKSSDSSWMKKCVHWLLHQASIQLEDVTIVCNNATLKGSHLMGHCANAPDGNGFLFKLSSDPLVLSLEEKHHIHLSSLSCTLHFDPQWISLALVLGSALIHVQVDEMDAISSFHGSIRSWFPSSGTSSEKEVSFVHWPCHMAVSLLSLGICLTTDAHPDLLCTLGKWEATYDKVNDRLVQLQMLIPGYRVSMTGKEEFDVMEWEKVRWAADVHAMDAQQAMARPDLANRVKAALASFVTAPESDERDAKYQVRWESECVGMSVKLHARVIPWIRWFQRSRRIFRTSSSSSKRPKAMFTGTFHLTSFSVWVGMSKGKWAQLAVSLDSVLEEDKDVLHDRVFVFRGSMLRHRWARKYHRSTTYTSAGDIHASMLQPDGPLSVCTIRGAIYDSLVDVPMQVSEVTIHCNESVMAHARELWRDIRQAYQSSPTTTRTRTVRPVLARDASLLAPPPQTREWEFMVRSVKVDIHTQEHNVPTNGWFTCSPLVVVIELPSTSTKESFHRIRQKPMITWKLCEVKAFIQAESQARQIVSMGSLTIKLDMDTKQMLMSPREQPSKPSLHVSFEYVHGAWSLALDHHLHNIRRRLFPSSGSKGGGMTISYAGRAIDIDLHLSQTNPMDVCWMMGRFEKNVGGVEMEQVQLVTSGREIFSCERIVQHIPESNAGDQRRGYKLVSPHITLPVQFHLGQVWDELFFAYRSLKVVRNQTSSKQSSSSMVLHVLDFVFAVEEDPLESSLGMSYLIHSDAFMGRMKRYEEMMRYLVEQRSTAEEIQEHVHAWEASEASRFCARMRKAKELHHASLFRLSCPELKGNVRVYTNDLDRASKALLALNEQTLILPDSAMETLSRVTHTVLEDVQLRELLFLVRDYPVPLIRYEAMQLNVDWISVTETPVSPDSIYMDVIPISRSVQLPFERNQSPQKLYYNISMDVQAMHICHGRSYDPAYYHILRELQRVSRPGHGKKILSDLTWWDRIRLQWHGQWITNAKQFIYVLPSTRSPYNTARYLSMNGQDVLLAFRTAQWSLNAERMTMQLASHGRNDYLFDAKQFSLIITLLWNTTGGVDPHDHSIARTPEKCMKQFGSTELNWDVTLNMHHVHPSHPMVIVEPQLFGFWYQITNVYGLTYVSRPFGFRNMPRTKRRLTSLYRNVDLRILGDCLTVQYWESRNQTQPLGASVTLERMDLGAHWKKEGDAWKSSFGPFFMKEIDIIVSTPEGSDRFTQMMFEMDALEIEYEGDFLLHISTVELHRVDDVNQYLVEGLRILWSRSVRNAVYSWMDSFNQWRFGIQYTKELERQKALEQSSRDQPVDEDAERLKAIEAEAREYRRQASETKLDVVITKADDANPLLEISEEEQALLSLFQAPETDETQFLRSSMDGGHLDMSRSAPPILSLPTHLAQGEGTGMSISRNRGVPSLLSNPLLMTPRELHRVQGQSPMRSRLGSPNLSLSPLRLNLHANSLDASPQPKLKRGEQRSRLAEDMDPKDSSRMRESVTSATFVFAGEEAAKAAAARLGKAKEVLEDLVQLRNRYLIRLTDPQFCLQSDTLKCCMLICIAEADMRGHSIYEHKETSVERNEVNVSAHGMSVYVVDPRNHDPNLWRSARSKHAMWMHRPRAAPKRSQKESKEEERSVLDQDTLSSKDLLSMIQAVAGAENPHLTALSTPFDLQYDMFYIISENSDLFLEEENMTTMSFQIYESAFAMDRKQYGALSSVITQLLLEQQDSKYLRKDRVDSIFFETQLSTVTMSQIKQVRERVRRLRLQVREVEARIAFLKAAQSDAMDPQLMGSSMAMMAARYGSSPDARTGQQRLLEREREIEKLTRTLKSRESMYLASEELLSLMVEAERRKRSTTSSKPTAKMNFDVDLLRWLMLDEVDGKKSPRALDASLFCEMSLRGLNGTQVRYEDQSGHYRFEVNRLTLRNLSPNCGRYKDMLTPLYADAWTEDDVMMRYYARQRAPVGGICVYEHCEMNIAPLNVQLAEDIFPRWYAYHFETDPASEASQEHAAGTKASSEMGTSDSRNDTTEDVSVATTSTRPGHSRKVSWDPKAVNLPSSRDRAGSSPRMLAPPGLILPGSPRTRPLPSRGHSRQTSLVDDITFESLASDMSEISYTVSEQSDDGTMETSVVPTSTHLDLAANQDVQVMKERAKLYRSFVYIKVTGFELAVIWKRGVVFEKHRALLHSMDYTQKLWSWDEFASRLKRDVLVDVLSQTGSFLKRAFKTNKDRVVQEIVDPEDVDLLDLYTFLRRKFPKKQIEEFGWSKSSEELSKEAVAERRRKKAALIYRLKVEILMGASAQSLVYDTPVEEPVTRTLNRQSTFSRFFKRRGSTTAILETE